MTLKHVLPLPRLSISSPWGYFLFFLIFLLSSLGTEAQTLEAQYLRPKFLDARYDFLRFGTSSAYYAGFMYNKTDANYGDGNDFSIFTYNNRDITFRTGTGNVIFFPSLGGNVGIGTQNPTQKLEVNGNIYLPLQSNSSGSILFKGHPTDNASIRSERFGSASGTRLRFEVTDDQDDYFSFNHRHWSLGTIEVLKIQRNGLRVEGNVGIGTDTPSEKLEVNGVIRSTEIKVEAAPWPDYVFEESYDLKDLSEVENFIKQNGHLPNIPSAAEVEKEGIKVGEMNAKLLEKIEELTLHLIELKKENDTLKAQQSKYDALLERIEKLENKK